MKRLLKLRYIVVSFSVLILLWYLLASVSSVGEALFPKPLTVGKALVDLFADGTMGANIGASLYRFAIGYVTSVVSAAILGLLICVDDLICQLAVFIEEFIVKNKSAANGMIPQLIRLI